MKSHFAEQMLEFSLRNFGRHVYESIRSLGKDMRQKSMERVFLLSSMNWRFYASRVANLWSFQQVGMMINSSNVIPGNRSGKASQFSCKMADNSGISKKGSLRSELMVIK